MGIAIVPRSFFSVFVRIRQYTIECVFSFQSKTDVWTLSEFDRNIKLTLNVVKRWLASPWEIPWPTMSSMNWISDPKCGILEKENHKCWSIICYYSTWKSWREYSNLNLYIKLGSNQRGEVSISKKIFSLSWMFIV